MQRIKQVILIRRDLKMRRGKEIAQGSHAAMEFLTHQIRQALTDNNPINITLTDFDKAWISQGTAKVCLQVSTEQQLLDHHEKALRLGIKSYLIRDSGRTEFGGIPTLTACAIGPDETQRIDLITGDLELY